MSKKSTRQSGQVVLITLLVLTIATTVALSLVSRTTTDTTITNQIEESSRAFSAAEAGVEEALRSGVGSGGTQVLSGGEASYAVTVASIGGAAGVFQFPKKTLRGVTETLWLVNHNASGQLVETPTYTASTIGVCWSSETITPALIATVLYKESTDGSYRVAKAAFDPDATRAGTDNFTSSYTAGGCGGTTGTAYRVTITFSGLDASINPAVDTLLALRLRPVYADAKLAIDAGVQVLPLQGNKIDSTGSTSGGTNRKIVVFQQYRSPSTIFDAAVYSQGSIVK
jgi:Tfp pilus assembly protein PilX